MHGGDVREIYYITGERTKSQRGPNMATKKTTRKAAIKKAAVKKAAVKKVTVKGRYKSKDFKQTVVTLDAAEMATICNALEYYKANRLLTSFLAQRK